MLVSAVLRVVAHPTPSWLLFNLLGGALVWQLLIVPAQIQRLRTLAEEAQLDPEFSEKFIRFVIDEVIRHHEQAREA